MLSAFLLLSTGAVQGCGAGTAGGVEATYSRSGQRTNDSFPGHAAGTGERL